MRLILVRHGETEINRLGRIQGVGPTPLNDTGLKQAADAAQALERDAPFTLYSSPLRRAAQTAAAIASRLDIEIAYEDGLVEMDVGEFEGLTGPQMRERFPDVMRMWDEKAAEAVMPGGESLSAVQERAWRTALALAERHPAETVVAVTHNFTIQMILCAALDMPIESFRKLRIELGSITRLDLGRLEVDADCIVLLSVNETWHKNPSNPPA